MKPANKPCLKCGEVHWSSQPCAGAKLPEFVTKPVTPRNATASRNATVEPLRNATDKPGRIAAMEAEIEAQAAEIRQLKQLLAVKHDRIEGASKAICPECERRRLQVLDRVRKARAKGKAEVVEFKG